MYRWRSRGTSALCHELRRDGPDAGHEPAGPFGAWALARGAADGRVRIAAVHDPADTTGPPGVLSGGTGQRFSSNRS